MMQIGSLILLLGLLVSVAWFVGQPFSRRGLRRGLADDNKFSSLLAERDQVLDALQELDFDHSMGKIPAEEYPAQRAALLTKGAEILRQLDSVKTGQPSIQSDADYELRITQGAYVQVVNWSPDDEIESLIAARRASRKVRSGGFCPACGRPVLASDRFCPACGKAVQ
jgi:hypothetical protein